MEIAWAHLAVVVDGDVDVVGGDGDVVVVVAEVDCYCCCWVQQPGMT